MVGAFSSDGHTHSRPVDSWMWLVAIGMHVAADDALSHGVR